MMVHYNPFGITNVISLKIIKNMYHVTYNSSTSGGHAGPSGISTTPKGLHYLELKQNNNPSIMFAMTIRGNCKGHRKYEIRKAIEARCLQGVIGHPSQWDFEGLVCSNMITHCPLTLHAMPYKIFDPDLAGIRGKTVRKKHNGLP